MCNNSPEGLARKTEGLERGYRGGFEQCVHILIILTKQFTYFAAWAFWKVKFFGFDIRQILTREYKRVLKVNGTWMYLWIALPSP